YFYHTTKYLNNSKNSHTYKKWRRFLRECSHGRSQEFPFYKINDIDFYRFVLVCLLCFVHLKIDFLMVFRLHILHVYHISWQCFSVYLYLYFGFYFVQTQKPPPNVFTNSMVVEPTFYESIRRLIYALT